MSMNFSSEPNNNIGFQGCRAAAMVAENQKRWQWVNNNDFYAMLPTPYYSFYNNWVRLWLYGMTDYVPLGSRWSQVDYYQRILARLS